MNKFEYGKTYEIVGNFNKCYPKGTQFTVGQGGLTIDCAGDVVFDYLGITILTVACFHRLSSGDVVEVKKKMTLEGIVDSDKVFVVLREDGGSMMYYKGLLAGLDNSVDPVISKVHNHRSSKDLLPWFENYAKEVYLAEDYPDGDPVWVRESEEEKRKKVTLKEMEEELERLTKSYNKLKEVLK